MGAAGVSTNSKSSENSEPDLGIFSVSELCQELNGFMEMVLWWVEYFPPLTLVGFLGGT